MRSLELGAAALLAVCVLAGCSRDKVRPCDVDGRYSAAESVPPVRIPDDLSPPNESDALRVPPETGAAGRTAPGCLETPPAFGTSGRGTGTAPPERPVGADAPPDEPPPGGDREISN
jgi:hypothetical protein